MNEAFYKIKSIFFILILLFACEENEDANDINSDAVQIGLFNSVLSHDGLTRQFIVYVPTNYDSNLR